jgi:glutamine cyclotransferase
MEPLIIGASEERPGINFDPQRNKFLIFGKSFPEEAKKFYEPVILWLEDYTKNPNKETNFEIRLDYYNSSTSTVLLEIFQLLNRLYTKGQDVKISWHYLEIDDDMLDAGKEYSEMTEVPFKFIPFEDV